MRRPCRLAVLSTGRQDYGILRSTLVLLSRDPRFDLMLWIGGMHLKERFGRCAEMVAADGLDIAREFDFVSEPPDGLGDSARALNRFGEALVADAPDALMLVGDRTETLSAGFAATITRIPIVHIHGGEETEGAIDNVLRHALTKLSHLHLVSHETHAARVIQMGEDPRMVHVVGAPGLDNMYRSDLPDRAALEQDLGQALQDPLVIVTMHATTLIADPLEEVSAVAEAAERVPGTYVITQPNADAGGADIRTFWLRWAEERQSTVVVDALGVARFWGLLRIAAAMVSNSSSGIIEAPVAGVPVINVGDRQKGRLRGPGVRDVPAVAGAIEAALRGALEPERGSEPEERESPYPIGPAAPRIVEILAAWDPPARPRKPFHDRQTTVDDVAERSEFGKQCV